MYEIQQRQGVHETFVLRDATAPSQVEVVPARGAIVTRFQVGAREVLYMDPETLADPARNVRGGIPVLFPIAGRLTGDSYVVDGVRYVLKQHGFARTWPWRVHARDTTRGARLTLALDSDEGTRVVFPWDFELRITYALAGRTLAVEQEYVNTGVKPMPLHAGFHPYFLVPDGSKRGTTITTDATRAFDNRAKAVVDFTGFDLTQGEVDLHLLDQRARTTRLVTPHGAVAIEMDDVFKTVVVWTVAGRDFVCVEPWTAPADALNTGEAMVLVGPGETLRARFAITAE